MKKFLIVLGIMAVCGVAWALPDRVNPSEVSGSQAIKATSGTVYGVLFSYKGVTAGDYIQIIDGSTSSQTSVDATIYAPTTNGSTQIILPTPL